MWLSQPGAKVLAPEPGPHERLNLFPTWPREWDADFKLHAPGQTILEAVLRGGRLEALKITPQSRARDVVNWLNLATAPAAKNPLKSAVPADLTK